MQEVLRKTLHIKSIFGEGVYKPQHLKSIFGGDSNSHQQEMNGSKLYILIFRFCISKHPPGGCGCETTDFIYGEHTVQLPEFESLVVLRPRP